ncbi:MAG: hypothetical protein U0790_07500 [Isosphaeraceae bacterium]
MGRLTPIFELGVDEAYRLLVERLGVDHLSLPPLDAIENEDWGRDLLLSRFLDVPPDLLAQAGLCLESPEESD